MDQDKLELHVRNLIDLPETEAPVLSCYVRIAAGEVAEWPALEERIRTLRRSLLADKRQLSAFLEALAPAQASLRGLDPEAKGAAVFSRGGEQPFLLPYSAEIPSATDGACFARLGPERPIPVDVLEPGNKANNTR